MPIYFTGGSFNGGTITGVILGPAATAAAPTYSFSAATNEGIYRYDGGGALLGVGLVGGGACILGVFNGARDGIALRSDGQFFWNNTTLASALAPDIGFSRSAAGIVEINNGTTGTRRWFTWAGAARVSTQFDKTADTTLANITGLTINVLAGRSVRFEALLYTTSNIAGGIKAAISGTSTATAIVYEAVVFSAGVSVAIGTPRATALDTTVGDVTTVTVGTILITGLITVNAAGTLTVQFAQNASNGAASSVLVGSSLIAYDVP